jgi:hypothetical protein
MHRFLERPIFQYAWVVQDLKAAARCWSKLFGAGPFFFNRHHKAEGYHLYRGKQVEADVSYAFGYSGPVQIQLIATHDDTPSIYREMFAPGAEGFHHVAIYSEDLAGDRQHMLNNGLDLAVEMWSGADVAYYDARPQIGCFVEIHGRTPVIDEIFALWKRAHAEWDGVTDPIREIDLRDIERIAKALDLQAGAAEESRRPSGD